MTGAPTARTLAVVSSTSHHGHGNGPIFKISDKER
jgi:hypothetical protein